MALRTLAPGKNPQAVVTRRGAWRAVLERYPFTRALSAEERARLRELVVLFLHEKSIVGAGGLVVRDEMRMCIAAQACMLILNLDLDYYRGWVEVIVYPDEFVAEYEYVDEDGVAHHVEEPMIGRILARGAGDPVVGGRRSCAGASTGYNVVIHEFAHKLDMLNGDANGFPPLHAGHGPRRVVAALSAPPTRISARRVEREEPHRHRPLCRRESRPNSSRC